MSMYDPRIVYPPAFDEIDFSMCEDCVFECDVHGYCINEVD